MEITGSTRVLGILGDPVVHSYSPRMQNAAFRAMGLDCVYVAFPVPAARLRDAVTGIRALGLHGVNVTVPHKTAVMEFLDSVSDRARLVGAVNTIVNRRGQLLGENTDVTGFIDSLRARGIRIRGRNALVIGAGGAARAVVAGLALHGARRIVIANRTASRVRALALNFETVTAIETAGIEALRDASLLATADLVVNATSIGLRGERFPSLEFAATPRRCVFYDLVYGKSTDFIRRARHHHRRAIDGTEMLVLQGAAAFKLWTRKPAPIAVMRAAVRA